DCFAGAPLSQGVPGGDPRARRSDPVFSRRARRAGSCNLPCEPARPTRGGEGGVSAGARPGRAARPGSAGTDAGSSAIRPADGSCNEAALGGLGATDERWSRRQRGETDWGTPKHGDGAGGGKSTPSGNVEANRGTPTSDGCVDRKTSSGHVEESGKKSVEGKRCMRRPARTFPLEALPNAFVRRRSFHTVLLPPSLDASCHLSGGGSAYNRLISLRTNTVRLWTDWSSHC